MNERIVVSETIMGPQKMKKFKKRTREIADDPNLTPWERAQRITRMEHESECFNDEGRPIDFSTCPKCGGANTVEEWALVPKADGRFVDRHSIECNGCGYKKTLGTFDLPQEYMSSNKKLEKARKQRRFSRAVWLYMKS